ncbi:hypothetical protein [Halomicronema sp. CCY15110]|uniref:hypothetical protein n=1 Tax=Halomicronema sp. CCY15110 TaxID=2767773 RepID=UPI00195132D9|nr:hypothetical protein [Halomicronema sp. CCY15110]
MSAEVKVLNNGHVTLIEALRQTQGQRCSPFRESGVLETESVLAVKERREAVSRLMANASFQSVFNFIDVL